MHCGPSPLCSARDPNPGAADDDETHLMDLSRRRLHRRCTRAGVRAAACFANIWGEFSFSTHALENCAHCVLRDERYRVWLGAWLADMSSLLAEGDRNIVRVSLVSRLPGH